MVQRMPEGYRHVEVMLDYEAGKVVTLGALTPEREDIAAPDCRQKAKCACPEEPGQAHLRLSKNDKRQFRERAAGVE